ncbi:hypothetical protein QWA68_010008 [Fusarium oxysporum]|nr:hypothetical protein QWA68_010008 [Fusarium oxysporum]
MCAIAAKHLYRVAKNQLNPKSNDSRWRGYDWRYESAKHYDEAIHHLKNAVDLCTYENSLSDREDMLAAVAILCIYELMDAPGTAWRAHLSALPLFNPTEDASHPASPVVIPRTAIQGPILWSLARQDLLCAFISETQTRLDLKDVRLWQNAGLATTEDGTLMPFSPPCSADIRTVADIEEDTKSNELTWLIGKLSNHLTSGDAINPSDYALPLGQRPTIGVTQERLLERWRMLLAEFKKWHDSLPSTFTPYARTPYPSSDSCFSNFTQIWYELPICAATMQNYHMAMILLLVNQPQESTFIRSTVSARLKSYRQIQQEVHHYAREICGVSLAEPSDPVRANSVQALFVAGQVFYEKGEQEAALKLLDDIETDLGWTTRIETMATSTFGPRLAGKVCIVTGSSSGLGRAIALAYSHEGAHLVCADLQPAARASVNGEEEVNTDELIRSNGGQAIFVETDVTKTAAVEQLLSRAVIQFGRIDVLVNNAGISVEAGKEPRRVHETPEDWWDLTLAVNLKSIFLVSKYVIAQMLKQDKSETGDRGWIINMSSIFGLVGGYTNAAYAASKGGVTNLTRTIALDYARDGIHCNAICPGFTETAIFADTIKTRDRDLIRSRHPLHGTGSPQDLVGAAIFLASQEARWVTGVNLPVDGGYTAQ